jgi:hypothetical protein
MQCHVEMTQPLIKAWLRSGEEEMKLSAKSPAVQRPADIERDMDSRLEALQAVANRIYDRWTANLRKGS